MFYLNWHEVRINMRKPIKPYDRDFWLRGWKTAFFIVCVILLAMPVSAKEVIDLQNYVECGLMSCSLEVDINELDLNKDGKNLVKGLTNDNFDQYISDLPNSMRNMGVSVLEEKLFITADIQPGSQNYWLMEFEEFVLDPWFNSSLPHCTNMTLNNTGLDIKTDYQVPFNISNATGFRHTDFRDLIFINDSVNGSANAIELDHWKEDFSSSAWVQGFVKVDTIGDEERLISYCYGNDSIDSSDGNATMLYWDDFDRGGDQADVGGQWVEQETVSTLRISNDMFMIENGASWDRIYTHLVDSGQTNITYGFTWWASDDSSSEPIIALGSANNTFDVGDGIDFGMLDSEFKYLDNGGWQTVVGYTKEVWYHIEIENIDTRYYNATINGTEYALEKRGYPETDFTDVAIGGRESGDDGKMNYFYARKFGQDPVVTYGILQNASEEPAEPPPVVVSASYVICSSNTTLYDHNVITINESTNITDEYTLCVYGCDNVTASCYPEPYIQDLWTFGLVLAFFVIIGIVWRLSK